MIERITSGDIIHKLAEHKKFMVFCHLRSNGLLAIRPTWDPHPVVSDSSLEIFQELFPKLVIFEGYIDELYDEIIQFNLPKNDLFYQGSLKPLIITFEKGWIKTTSLNKCYCYETLTEMIKGLHPEFFEG
jgi:hypothetical protein